MEKKLRELTGQPNVWLYIKSSNGWIKNVEILEVSSETVTFRYEHESEAESRIWEKTTRLDNIVEIDIRVLAMPKNNQQVEDMRSKLSKLLEQD
jgi:ABC-type histidine transport system ATPase subunit